MIAKLVTVGLVATGGLVVAGCAGGVEQGTRAQTAAELDRDSLEAQRARSGSVLDIFGLSATVGPNAPRRDPLSGSNVNRHLWLASLDTLSFLPIASTDPFSGVIATDWGGVTDTGTERFRVTAFVTDTTLTPESLRVAVYRQVRGPDGTWVPADVAAQTPRQIEDSILVRARQIRLEERGAS